MAIQIQLRRGTAAEWVASNPILADGEAGAETDTGRMKLGNGTSTWSVLIYSDNAGTIAAGSSNTSMTGLVAGNGTKITAPTSAQVDNLPIGDAGGYYPGLSTLGGQVQSVGSQLAQNVDYRTVEMFIQNYEPNVGIDFGPGEPVSYAPAITTQVIPCLGFTKIIVSGRNAGSLGMVYYDAGGGKIKPTGESDYHTSTTSGELIIPAGAVSFRMSSGAGDKYTWRLWLGNGATAVSGGEIASINGVRVGPGDVPESIDRYIASGSGTDADPYISNDDAGGLMFAKYRILTHSGKIRIPCKTFKTSAELLLDIRACVIEGDAWNYSKPPNGVYPSEFGSKIELGGTTYAGIRMSYGASGGRLAHFGIQGTTKNSNTQGLFSVANYRKNTGIYLESYLDQVEINKINFNGLASGISAQGSTEIDACTIDWINADGCNVGIYFRPDTAYYTIIRNCLLADCPAQGLWMEPSGAGTHANMLIENLTLVRNSGGITVDQLAESVAASAVMIGLVRSTIRGNRITQTGVWSEYFSSGDNSLTLHTVTATGLVFDGTSCEITGNTIYDSTGRLATFAGDDNQISDNYFGNGNGITVDGDNNVLSANCVDSTGTYSIEVNGDYNKVIMCDVDKPIYVTGNNNRIMYCTPRDPALAVIVIVAAGATDNILQGFAVGEYTDGGTGTVIR